MAEREWEALIKPLVRRFDVAAAFDGQAVWNAEGSKAMSSIIKTMAKMLDDEIERQHECASLDDDDYN